MMPINWRLPRPRRLLDAHHLRRIQEDRPRLRQPGKKTPPPILGSRRCGCRFTLWTVITASRHPALRVPGTIFTILRLSPLSPMTNDNEPPCPVKRSFGGSPKRPHCQRLFEQPGHAEKGRYRRAEPVSCVSLRHGQTDGADLTNSQAAPTL